MNALVVVLLTLWLLCLGSALFLLLSRESAAASHVNAFLDFIFPVGGPQ